MQKKRTKKGIIFDLTSFLVLSIISYNFLPTLDTSIHISLAAERLFSIGEMDITNTFLITILISIILAVGAIWLYYRISWQPGRVQNFLELVLENMLEFTASITGSRQQAIKFFPLIVTIFVVVFLSNMIEIVPGLGTIGFLEKTHGKTVIVPFLRSASADLNFTLAIAIGSVFGTQMLGMAMVGFFSHWKKFFYPPWKEPYLIGTFLGVLELVAEIAKMMSFSFRLFGNIFAGEVLLTVVLFLAPIGAPLPFLFLEIFVGFIQALVFSMLTLVFLKVAAEHH